jgi:RNA polymerase sigma factor (sigma-70 family)
MSIQDQVNTFVQEFMKKHNSLINSVGRKFLIPNRYNIDDIKQYISERIINILGNRLKDSKDGINDPEKYFKSCISFYCIEYQRMHGYVFELPKRPRKNCEQDESYIRSFGFKYLGDMTNEEYNSLITREDLTNKDSSTSWKYLLDILSKEEAEVIDCIFNKNLTWQETSNHLGVPQSTCWIRKDRALEKIFRVFEKLKVDNLYDAIRKFLRGDPSVLNSIKRV